MAVLLRSRNCSERLLMVRTKNVKRVKKKRYFEQISARQKEADWKKSTQKMG